MRLHAYPILSPANIRVYDLLVVEPDLNVIAEQLKISKRGVKHHVSEILARTKCANRHEFLIKHYSLVNQTLANIKQIMEQAA